MRIIGKNTDFYDYLQGIYPDDSVMFDRTGAFALTKDDVCSSLYASGLQASDLALALLQVCNRFWLFIVEVTEDTQESRWCKYADDKPTKYSVEQVVTWTNYDKPRTLMRLNFIRFSFDIFRYISEHPSRFQPLKLNREKILERTETLIKAVDTDNYTVCDTLIPNRFIEYGKVIGEKPVALLKASGFSVCMNPLDIYLAFDEYFSLEKSSSERTSTLDITDKEKVVNHGFDIKQSFRGKNTKGGSKNGKTN